MESITRPFFHHRRKLSNLNNSSSSNNGMSFSGKDAYDDVLLVASKSKLGGVGGLAPGGAVGVEDYAEIFGAGTGSSGVGSVKRGSSIPVLDLSELDRSSNNGSYDSRGLNEKLDYSKIFGSFAADVHEDVPPYEELFGGVKKTKCDKAKKPRNPTVTKSPPKGSDCLNTSENSREFSSEASDQFLDVAKQLNMSYHKTSQRTTDGLNGTTHIAQLHAVPGFTYFIDEAAHLRKTELDKPFPQVKTDAIHSGTSSGDLSEGKPSRRGRWKLPDRQASEGMVSGKDDSGWSEVDFKPYASDVPIPSSTSANSNDDQGHPKRVKSSKFGPKAVTFEKNSNGYSSPSDEELDVNSAAAASAAALKKAIQQAQESIRLAKELMERKKDPVQNSKPCVNGSFKVNDKREIKYDKDMNGCRKNNTEKARKPISSDAPAFGGFDLKITRRSDEIASSLRCREDLSINKKVDTEKCKPSVEGTEEQGVGTWFSQLLNNGKSKMAALASQLVDNRNATGQPTSKDMQGAEETIPANGTLRRGTSDIGDTNVKLDTLENVPDFEKNLNESASDQFSQVGTRSETVMSSQEDRTTEVDHGFHHQEKCEQKEPDCEKATCSIEPKIQENGCPAKELNIVETKEEESFELVIRKQLDNLFMWPENGSSLDEKLNWRMPEGFCVQKGDEQKLEEVTAVGRSDKKQESSQHEDFSMSRLEGYPQEDIEEQRSICSPENIERKNTLQGENICEDIDQTPKMMYQHEGTDILDVSADDSADSDNIKVNLEDQESYDREGEPDESKENLGPSLFPETANEENFSACKMDYGTVTEGTSEASEVRKTSELSRPLECTVLEEDDDQIDAKELLEIKEEKGHIELRQDEKEAQQSVEEASVIKENEMFETSSLDHNIPQEHVLESTVQDTSKALDSDDNTYDFVLDTSIHEKRPSADMNLLKTTILNTGHGVEYESATEAPMVGEKPSDCEFAYISKQKEVEESDEECEVSFRPENWEGVANEPAVDAKDIKEDDVASEAEFEKHNFELDNKENDWVEKKLEPDCSRLPASEAKESEEDLESNTDTGTPDQTMDNYEENISKTSVKEEKENTERVQKEVKEKDFVKRTEIDQREREREKDRLAVERAIREARERAFAEARERAERAAVERANAEVRQRAMAGARDKVEKLSSGPKASTDKATTEAKLRAERAAVERATAEARGRALEKALSQKSTTETRSQVEKVVAGKSSAASRDAGLKHSFSSSDLEGTHNESAQRRKARLERHQRIMERAAKALAEKNMRDILAQREQAERNRLAETLDADIKRWASGKEGNLRALLSTLQYILGPDSGWQSMSLTEIITTNAVKKAYRKATLYVHPDKLQQRGASIQQKYICEKVFDLLKAAWNKFNSEER